MSFVILICEAAHYRFTKLSALGNIQCYNRIGNNDRKNASAATTAEAATAKEATMTAKITTAAAKTIASTETMITTTKRARMTIVRRTPAILLDVYYLYPYYVWQLITICCVCIHDQKRYSSNDNKAIRNIQIFHSRTGSTLWICFLQPFDPNPKQLSKQFMVSNCNAKTMPD